MPDKKLKPERIAELKKWLSHVDRYLNSGDGDWVATREDDLAVNDFFALLEEKAAPPQPTDEERDKALTWFESAIRHATAGTFWPEDEANIAIIKSALLSAPSQPKKLSCEILSRAVIPAVSKMFQDYDMLIDRIVANLRSAGISVSDEGEKT